MRKNRKKKKEKVKIVCVTYWVFKQSPSQQKEDINLHKKGKKESLKTNAHSSADPEKDKQINHITPIN